jgi:hypothetical protein
MRSMEADGNRATTLWLTENLLTLDKNVKAMKMNTRIIMTASALVMGLGGLSLTFMPDVILMAITIEASKPAILVMQILGALYFGFAMLNWMSKGNLIGGIYNRPVAVANFSHFLIAGLALLKALASNPGVSSFLWTAGIIYLVLAAAFGVMLFQHPLREAAAEV